VEAAKISAEKGLHLIRDKTWGFTESNFSRAFFLRARRASKKRARADIRGLRANLARPMCAFFPASEESLMARPSEDCKMLRRSERWFRAKRSLARSSSDNFGISSESCSAAQRGEIFLVEKTFSKSSGKDLSFSGAGTTENGSRLSSQSIFLEET